MKYRSQYEDEIINEIKKFYSGEITPNKYFVNSNNKRFEIDVYLPEFNLGIDFGGMWWHSHINKDKKYHHTLILFNVLSFSIIESSRLLNFNVVR